MGRTSREQPETIDKRIVSTIAKQKWKYPYENSKIIAKIAKEIRGHGFSWEWRVLSSETWEWRDKVETRRLE